METVAYSREKILQKLQLCLGLVNDSEDIQFREVVHIVQILKGRDDSCENKLKSVCRNAGLGIDGQSSINKLEIMEILSSHMSVFFF